MGDGGQEPNKLPPFSFIFSAPPSYSPDVFTVRGLADTALVVKQRFSCLRPHRCLFNVTHVSVEGCLQTSGHYQGRIHIIIS